MATTTNFGWETPDDTDLVKDGAAAIRTALGGVDTSFVDLKGGTTGQVLSKATNTDLDFTWTTSSGIQATIVDAKGDLIAATAADTVARLAVGTNGQILTADSTAATGLAWTTLASQKVVQIVAATYSTSTSNSTITYSDTGLTATITPTSASNKVLVIWNQGGLQKTATSAASEVDLKLMRGASTIATGFAGYTNTALNVNPGNVGAAILDSPATTSATTYKSQFRNGTAAAAAVVQYNSSTSSLILIEVTP